MVRDGADDYATGVLSALEDGDYGDAELSRLRKEWQLAGGKTPGVGVQFSDDEREQMLAFKAAMAWAQRDTSSAAVQIASFTWRPLAVVNSSSSALNCPATSANR